MVPHDCTYFWTNIISAADVTAICSYYDFANLSSLRLFVNGSPDVNGSSQTVIDDILASTGAVVTAADMTAFYATSNTGVAPTADGTFGEVILFIQ